MLEQVQSLGNCGISWVEFCSPSIGVNSVPYLIIAAFVEATKIKPDFRYVRIDADSP
jgi:hypothetical protein